MVPRSLYDWKYKFFYVDAAVAPLSMRFRELSEEVSIPDADILSCLDRTWFRAITAHVCPILGVPEACLVGVGMSRVWDNPRTAPVIIENAKGLCFSC